MNYYEILEVHPVSSQEVIKAAYRALSRKYHPDLNGNGTDQNYYHERMKLINLAYSVLSDELRREAYDQSLGINRINTNDYNVKREQETKNSSSFTEKKNEDKSNTVHYQAKTKKIRSRVMLIISFILLIAVHYITTIGSLELNQTVPLETAEPLAGLPLPRTGVFSDTYRDKIAPFTIITSKDSNNYYVKMEKVSDGKTELVFFIRKGEKIDALVPLGDYTIKYAVGDSWYGDEYLFGDETQYFKANEVFEFYEDHEGITGWTIELIYQSGGNLDTIKIGEKDW